eukprot:9213221-Pyramimonas_sp.AAC.1
MATATIELQERWTSINSGRLGDFASLLGSLLDHHVTAADLWITPNGFVGASANRERQDGFPWMIPSGFPWIAPPAISSSHERISKNTMRQLIAAHRLPHLTSSPSFMTIHAHPPPSGAGAHCAHDMNVARRALHPHLACLSTKGKVNEEKEAR